MAATINRTQNNVSGTGNTTVYTASSAGSIIVRIDVGNGNPTPVAFTLSIGSASYVKSKSLAGLLGAPGLPTSADEPLAGLYTLPAPGGQPFLLKSGDTIVVSADSSGNAVTVSIYAIDLT